MDRLTAVVLGALLSATAAFGSPVVVLDGLTGELSLGGQPPGEAPSAREMTFTFPDSVAAITGLRLTMLGDWTPGMRLYCREVGSMTICDTLPAGTNLTLRLRAVLDDHCVFAATVPVWHSAYADEQLIGACDLGIPDIDALLEGEVVAELYCDMPPEVVVDYVEAAHGTMTSVQLELLGAVPASASSWGAVKAIFR